MSMKMNEVNFKKELLSFFEIQGTWAINFEFPYDYNKRRCDVLCVSRDETLAIEVKSDIDKITNLKAQLDSYYKVFNSIYVACGKEHLASIKSIKGRFGIIFIDENGCRIIRKAKYRKFLDVHSILDMLDKKVLERVSGMSGKNKNDTIDLVLNTFSKEQVHNIYYNALYEKVIPIYRLYLKEKGGEVVDDDITLLSLKTMILPFN
ncbi:sce7726 family protein [uncultured Enterobacter sp.]|uniref:sce7726 family protein n=1 Tax=uncultured Enterobacter sp. TaxID=238202 RepID=UPI0025EEB163|nr:sce7726 family protein [uncultured Enterobacter sp.]